MVSVHENHLDVSTACATTCLHKVKLVHTDLTRLLPRSPVIGHQLPSGHPTDPPSMPGDHPDPPPRLHPRPQALLDGPRLHTTLHTLQGQLAALLDTLSQLRGSLLELEGLEFGCLHAAMRNRRVDSRLYVTVQVQY